MSAPISELPRWRVPCIRRRASGDPQTRVAVVRARDCYEAVRLACEEADRDPAYAEPGASRWMVQQGWEMRLPDEECAA